MPARSVGCRDSRRCVALVALVAVASSGCSSASDRDASEGTDVASFRYYAEGRGLGEWADRGAGSHRVLAVYDQATNGARSVVVMVEECAPLRRPITVDSSGWQLVLEDDRVIETQQPLTPAASGVPRLPASGRLGPGSAAWPT